MLKFITIFGLIFLTLGWNEKVYSQNCQTVLAEIESTFPSASPLDTGWIDICLNSEVSFVGKGIYPNNNQTYLQSDATSTFTWEFGDGEVASGSTASHTFGHPGGFYVSLKIHDIMGCTNDSLVFIRVRVSNHPNFSVNIPFDTICLGDTISLSSTVMMVDSTKNISVAPEVNIFHTSSSVFNSFPLPDGTGVPFVSSLFLTQFPAGQTVTSSNDISSICLNIEHSWMRDLEITLICPSGATAVLHQFAGQTGGQVFLGQPIDNDGLNPIPGIGYEYCWRQGVSGLKTWIDYVNNFPSTSTLPEGDYRTYEKFDSLIGCPFNGEWKLQAIDSWPSDNGFIFSWEINFHPSYYPLLENFTNTFVDWGWANNSNILYNSPDSISSLEQVPGTYNQLFYVTDNFGCTWEKSINYTVMPPDSEFCTTTSTSYEVPCEVDMNFSNNTLHISQCLPAYSNARLQIFNLSGILLYDVTVPDNEVEMEVSLQGLELPTGVYAVQFGNHQQLFTKKIFIY